MLDHGGCFDIIHYSFLLCLDSSYPCLQIMLLFLLVPRFLTPLSLYRKSDNINTNTHKNKTQLINVCLPPSQKAHQHKLKSISFLLSFFFSSLLDSIPCSILTAPAHVNTNTHAHIKTHSLASCYQHFAGTEKWLSLSGCVYMCATSQQPKDS